MLLVGIQIRISLSCGSLLQIVILCHVWNLVLIIHVSKQFFFFLVYVVSCVIIYQFTGFFISSCGVPWISSGSYKWWTQPDACWGLYFCFLLCIIFRFVCVIIPWRESSSFSGWWIEKLQNIHLECFGEWFHFDLLWCQILSSVLMFIHFHIFGNWSKLWLKQNSRN